jgi:serine/threonine-protein kinase
VEELCDAALSRTGADRAAFVAAACGDDETLRQEVEVLLAHAKTAKEFLETPLGAVAATVLTDEPASVVGSQIGGYRILSLLGSGGMGDVYRARDTRLGREVAIKILPPAFTADVDRLARFEREARVLAALNHPNIAAIYGIEGGALAGPADAGRSMSALVMELVEGETLADRIARGPLRVADSLAIAGQIADALDAAHAKGIIHRDLKPANIKIRPDGAIKVLDFGLARVAVDGEALSSQSPTVTTDLTREGLVMGTAAYMSPEQARGKTVDKRTDVWAFGCVLYEMLTGKRAFDGEDMADALGAVIHKEPTWSRLPASTPPTVSMVLQRCLQKDPKQRVRDIGDVRLALEGAFQTAASIRDEPIRELGLRIWQRPVSIATIGVAVAIISGGAVWNLMRSGPSLPSRPTRFAITPPDSTPLANQPGFDVLVSPDGRRIAYLANDPERGRMLFVRDIDSLEARLIPGTENAEDAFFSPDGAWIAFERGTALVKVAASGGPLSQIVDTGAQILGGTWGADNRIVFGGIDGLYRVPAGGGSPAEPIAKREGEQYLGPRILPGGRALIFFVIKTGDSSIESARVGLLSLESGEERILFDGDYPFYASSGHLVFLRGTTLMAAPFDLDRLEVTGNPVALPVNVRRPDYWVSASGTLAYVPGTGAGGRTLVWVGRDGREEALALEPRFYSAPRVSPDGQRVAVSAANDIWIYDVRRGTTTRLTFDPANDVETLWSPDGQRVVFSSNRDKSFDLYWTRADGTGTPERLTTGASHEYPHAWGNGGRALLFTECSSAITSTRCDMSLLAMAGSAERQTKTLLRSEFSDNFPAVSPDGRWLAYESNAAGRLEIYVRPFPDVDGGRWQASTGGGTEPLWAPNGQELLYRGPTAVMAVPVESGSTPTFGKPQALFNVGRYTVSNFRDWDISPNGDRFIFAAPLTTEEGQIVIVENWFEELKRLVPTN